MSVKQSKRRLSMAIREQATESGVAHLIGAAERPAEERGLSMSQQLKVEFLGVFEGDYLSIICLCFVVFCCVVAIE